MIQYLFEKFKHKIKNVAEYVEEVQWQMKLERLMNLCRDTGGEDSPFFGHLQNHLEKDPRKKYK